MPKIMICSGAGLSAESGIATFRDSGGLWENHKIEEVCDITTFEANYIKVNEFYDARRKQLASVVPNDAHNKIAELTKKFEVINFTTNVDDLLERAGCEDVKHIHGFLPEVVHRYGTGMTEIVNVGHNDSQFDVLDLYPVKPNVVFFGEHAPMYQDLHNALTDLQKEDLLIVVGSSEQVVDFVSTARYLCKFEGRIHFVNKDFDLGMNKQINEFCQSFNMSATAYFNDMDFDALLEVDGE